MGSFERELSGLSFTLFLKVFVIFFIISIKTKILAKLTPVPPPHGVPHSPTYPNICRYVCSNQQAQKKCLIIKASVILRFLKLKGQISSLVNFGTFGPPSARACNSRATSKGLLRVPAPSTNHPTNISSGQRRSFT